MSLPIPKNLIASLDAVFQREAKKLGADIAKALRLPEKEVLDVLKKMDKIQYKIYDTDENETTCPVFINASKVAERCRRPCLLGTNRCLHHQSNANVCNYDSSLKELTRCVCSDPTTQEKTLLLEEDTNLIYNSSGDTIGIIEDDEEEYNKKVLYEFIIEPEEEG